MLTQDILRDKLHYNPITGIFTWITKPNSKRKILIAGHTYKSTGYVTIRICKQLYLAHRLAFLYMLGYLPPYQVDHINRVRNDNRWNNLRLATPSENNINKKQSENEMVGIGVRIRKGRPGIWYTAYIQKDNKKYRTMFRDIEKAKQWRKKKEMELFKGLKNAS